MKEAVDLSMRPILEDPTRGVVSEAEFLERVNGEGACFRSVLTSEDPVEVLVAVVQAFAFGYELCLPAGDDGEGEREDLPAPVQVPVGRFRDWEALVRGMESDPGGGVILHTSGTTGRPKAVRHDFRSLTRGVRRAPHHANDVWALAYHPTHIAGLQVLLQAFLNRNPVVCLFAKDRETVLDRIQRNGVTHISATPTFYRLLLPVDRTFPGVRRYTFGGEKWDPALAASMGGFFPNARALNIYASTEAGTLLVAEGDVFSVSAENLANVRIREGRLQLRAAGFPTVGTEESWYDTGDEVECLPGEPLRFRFVKRAGSEINVGGYKVDPQAVEEVLREHPLIREARVHARRNRVTGWILMADLVASGPEPPSEKELRHFLSGRFESYQIPRIIRFVPQLETTRTGKLKR